MDLVMTPAQFGRSGQKNGGPEMADAPTVIGGVLGSGVVVAVVTHLLGKGSQKKSADDAAYAARMAEAIALRDSDRDRLQALENWRTEAMDWQDRAVQKMEEMRTDKIRLEGIIDALNHQIAADKVLLAQFEQDRISFTTQISALNERIAAQASELRSAYSRLEAIKSAAARGEMTQSMLYQKTKEGTETAIVTGAPGEIL